MKYSADLVVGFELQRGAEVLQSLPVPPGAVSQEPAQLQRLRVLGVQLEGLREVLLGLGEHAELLPPVRELRYAAVA